MKTTVLPVRNRPEARPAARPAPAPPRPSPAGELAGLPSTTVELRAECRRPLPVSRPAASATASPPVPAPAPPPVPSAGAAAVEIELPNGRIIRVPPGFASHDLERALAIAAGEEAPAPAATPASPEPGR
jgi:hypothetical protein